MKTIKELRDLIILEGGSLKIGVLDFSYEEGKDVDVRCEGALLTWFSKSLDDESLLSVPSSVVSGYETTETQSKISKLESELDEKVKALEILNEETLSLKAKANQEVITIGKLEAYEKLLFTRKVTLE